MDKEGMRQVFEHCHGSTTEGGHGGPKKTQEKIKSLFFWRGIVKDVINWVNLYKINIKLLRLFDNKGIVITADSSLRNLQ